jgi:hypothetical protein
MLCASCDREIPGGGVICLHCDPPVNWPARAATSHHELARTVRRVKGLVVASFVFGIVFAPFAIVIATRALVRHRDVMTTDPAVSRQLVLLRRIATALLVFWGFLIGMQAAYWRAA